MWIAQVTWVMLRSEWMKMITDFWYNSGSEVFKMSWFGGCFGSSVLVWFGPIPRRGNILLTYLSKTLPEDWIKDINYMFYYNLIILLKAKECKLIRRKYSLLSHTLGKQYFYHSKKMPFVNAILSNSARITFHTCSIWKHKCCWHEVALISLWNPLAFIA